QGSRRTKRERPGRRTRTGRRCRVNRGHEAVSAAPVGCDEPGCGCRVAEGAAEMADRIVHGRARRDMHIGPERRRDLVTREGVPRVAEQQRQQAGGLRFESYRRAARCQVASLSVEREPVECYARHASRDGAVPGEVRTRQSARSTTAGSTDVARRTGTSVATTVASAIETTAIAYVSVSVV